LRRHLTSIETNEAELVFGDSLDFGRIWVYEETAFPNWIAKIGSIISGEDPPANNAITLGYRILFPILLNTSQADIENKKWSDMAWLMHELTHAWQYRHIGIRYLFQALYVQITLGSSAYDYGGENGLKDAHEEGKHFIEFNPEQQGDITRDYYTRLKQEKDTSAWDPFIDEIKSYTA
jgi:hypothetical protein